MPSNDIALENLSLRDLKNFEPHVPGLGGFVSRLLVNTYDEFIDELYTTIDKIISLKEQTPEFYQTDEEDKITLDIKNHLVMLGYDASHEEKIGGHADLVVRKNSYLWIGEAKIHRSYPYLWKGFQQLNTRYSIGDSNQKDGGLLIYIRQANAKSVMDRWNKHLLNQNLKNYISAACPKRSLAFFSTHTHNRSGEPFRVRHIGISFYFNPQDKM